MSAWITRLYTLRGLQRAQSPSTEKFLLDKHKWGSGRRDVKTSADVGVYDPGSNSEHNDDLWDL